LSTAGFFFAYFEYSCRASTGYVRGHFWPSPFPPPTPSSSSATTSPPAASPLPRQVYSYNRRRLRPLFAALRLATALEPRQQVPRHSAKFILVLLYACSVLATPLRAFVSSYPPPLLLARRSTTPSSSCASPPSQNRMPDSPAAAVEGDLEL
jgi:hypothetical protein